MSRKKKKSDPYRDNRDIVDRKRDKLKKKLIKNGKKSKGSDEEN